MKARDRVAISALRSALAAIDNAESVAVDQPAQLVAESEHFGGSVTGLGAAEVQRRQLTEAEVHSIVANEVAERLAAANEYEQHGRNEPADRLRSEAEVLRRHL